MFPFTRYKILGNYNFYNSITNRNEVFTVCLLLVIACLFVVTGIYRQHLLYSVMFFIL